MADNGVERGVGEEKEVLHAGVLGEEDLMGESLLKERAVLIFGEEGSSVLEDVVVGELWQVKLNIAVCKEVVAVMVPRELAFAGSSGDRRVDACGEGTSN